MATQIRPRVGWKDCKLYVWHRRLLTEKQERALAPFIGIDITKDEGGAKALQFLETAKRTGVLIP